MSALYLTPETIRQYLRANIGIVNTTLGSELITALVFSIFYKKEQGHDFLIGLPVVDQVAKTHVEAASIERLNEILKEHIKSDTPTDFTLVPRNIAKDRKPIGYAYQVKRIGRGNVIGSTEDIINVINAIKGQYGKVDAQLLLILEPQTKEPIGFPSIAQRIDTTNYPFQKIMFTATRDEDILMVGEIWPTRGWNEYSISSFFKEDKETSHTK